MYSCPVPGGCKKILLAVQKLLLLYHKLILN
jgi:hypothetical protein